MCELCEAIKEELKDAPEITFKLPDDYYQMLFDSNLMQNKADEWGRMIKEIGISKFKMVIEKDADATEIKMLVFNIYSEHIFKLSDIKEQIDLSYNYLNS